MNKDLLELYSDYLLSSFSHTTATGLSRMSAGEITHDKITRFLALLARARKAHAPNLVEGQFCEIWAPERPGNHSHPRIFMHHHNM